MHARYEITSPATLSSAVKSTLLLTTSFPAADYMCAPRAAPIANFCLHEEASPDRENDDGSPMHRRKRQDQRPDGIFNGQHGSEK